MKTIHVDFKKKRPLTATELEDKLADESGLLQDPIIRMARSIGRYNARIEKMGFEHDSFPRK